MCKAACWLERNSFCSSRFCDMVPYLYIGFHLKIKQIDSLDCHHLWDSLCCFCFLFFWVFFGLDMKASCLRNMTNFINFKQEVWSALQMNIYHWKLSIFVFSLFCAEEGFPFAHLSPFPSSFYPSKECPKTRERIRPSKRIL